MAACLTRGLSRLILWVQGRSRILHIKGLLLNEVMATCAKQVVAENPQRAGGSSLANMIGWLLVISAALCTNTMAGITVSWGLALCLWLVALNVSLLKGKADQSWKMICNRFLAPVMAIYAVLISGLFLSENLPRALDMMASYWYLFVLLVVPYVLHQKQEKDFWEKILWGYLIGSIAASAWGCAQYFGKFSLEPGQRVGGNYHPLVFGQHICMGFFVTMYFFRRFPSWKIRRLLCTAGCLQLLAILLSQSRGPWVAFAGALVLWAWIMNWKKAALAIVLLGSLAGGLFLFHESFNTRILNVIKEYKQNQARSSVGTRMIHIHGSIQLWQTHPFLGIGTGDYRDEITALCTSGSIKNVKDSKNAYNLMHAHNMYLDWLARTGLVGMAVFVWFFWSLLAACLRLRKMGHANQSELGIAIFVFFLIAGIGENSIGRSPLIYVFLLLMAVITARAAITQTANAPDPAEPTGLT